MVEPEDSAGCASQGIFVSYSVQDGAGMGAGNCILEGVSPPSSIDAVREIEKRLQREDRWMRSYILLSWYEFPKWDEP
jgi:hypothetical protein